MTDAIIFTLSQMAAFSALSVAYIVRDYPWRTPPKNQSRVFLSLSLVAMLCLIVSVFSSGWDVPPPVLLTVANFAVMGAFLVIVVAAIAVWPSRAQSKHKGMAYGVR